MARIRTIKPEFWTDEKIMESSPMARLLLIGVLNFADDKGNIEAGLLSIKAKIFPSDDIDVLPLLSELEKNQLLIPYSVNGENYYNIRGFLKHQKIDNPSKPRCPLYESSTSPPIGLQDDSTLEGKGREGKGKELKPKGGAKKKENPSLLPKNKKELIFEDRWGTWEGEKDNKKLALKYWNGKIQTQTDVENYDKAVLNYYAIVDHDRKNGFPERKLKGGKTWFNNFENYINQKPPPKQAVGGIQPLPERNQKELQEKCISQLVFVQSELEAGEIKDYQWFYMALDKIVVEHKQRFGDTPFDEMQAKSYDAIKEEMIAKEEA